MKATLCKNGTCSAEVRIRIASAVAAMARLNRIWMCNKISFETLVTSILLYGCETWTLLDDSGKRIHAFETKCRRKLLCISYLQHKTNDWIRSKINFVVGSQEPLLATGTRRKLAWFGHVTRHDSLSRTVLQGTLEGGRRRGRQRKCPIYNIEWTFLPMPELLTRASSRKDWKRITAESFLVPPTTKSVKGLN